MKKSVDNVNSGIYISGGKTGQSRPYVARQKWAGSGWSIKQKWVNNHNPSRIGRANRQGGLARPVFFFLFFEFF